MIHGWPSSRPTLLDSFFPRRCIGCGAYDAWLCVVCAFTDFEPQMFHGDAGITAAEQRLADGANMQNHSNSIERLFTAAPYEVELLQHAMHMYKFEGAQDLASVFAMLLVEGVRYAKPERLAEQLVVVPVPLHRKRIRERGFDQNLALAQAAVEYARAVYNAPWALADTWFVRTRHTAHQTELSPTKRAQNLAGVFYYTGPSITSPQSRLLLIDDVVTTGATLASLATAAYAEGGFTQTEAAAPLRSLGHAVYVNNKTRP